jgi:hypothetical protein
VIFAARLKCLTKNKVRTIGNGVSLELLEDLGMNFYYAAHAGIMPDFISKQYGRRCSINLRYPNEPHQNNAPGRGEGMQCSKDSLEELITQFYSDNF